MELIQNNAHQSKDIINVYNHSYNSENYENLNYLYPNWHRTTHQSTWFKGSRDRGLNSDIPA